MAVCEGRLDERSNQTPHHVIRRRHGRYQEGAHNDILACMLHAGMELHNKHLLLESESEG